jgi:hypothetical protein
MELNISELDNINPYQSFDYNKFEEEEKYWEQEKTKKKKVTFDDILTNMNIVVNKQGVLQFMSSSQPNQYQNQSQNQYQNQTQNQYQNQYQNQTQNQYQNQYQNQSQNQYQNQYQNNFSKQQIQESIDPSLKHSFIYNKYFKDYIDPNLEKQGPRVPKTIEELKQMLIQDKIIAEQQRERISQIKSKKLMFTTNPNMNINLKNIVASKNNLKTMNFR